MDKNLGKSLIQTRNRIVKKFSENDWEELGLLTGMTNIIAGHGRLLRSLHFGDDDYDGNVLTVLRQMTEHDPSALGAVQEYLESKYPLIIDMLSESGDTANNPNVINASSTPLERYIIFTPSVFKVPDCAPEDDLVAVMMPFSQEYSPVYESIKRGVLSCNLRCLRADDIWEASTIMQDIFSLIYRAYIVIVDFTGKNPNVMYETGIAHTLGKHVVPITQSFYDLPSDMGHHRALKYLPNQQGLEKLSSDLSGKLKQLLEQAKNK